MIRDDELSPELVAEYTKLKKDGQRFSTKFREDNPEPESFSQNFQDSFLSGVGASIGRGVKSLMVEALHPDDGEFIWDKETIKQYTTYKPDDSDEEITIDPVLQTAIFRARSHGQAEAYKAREIERMERKRRQDKLSTSASIGYGLLSGIADPTNWAIGLGAVAGTAKLAKAVPAINASKRNRVLTAGAVGIAEGTVASIPVYLEDGYSNELDIVLSALTGGLFGSGGQAVSEAVRAKIKPSEELNDTNLSEPSDKEANGEGHALLGSINDSGLMNQSTTGAQQATGRLVIKEGATYEEAVESIIDKMEKLDGDTDTLYKEAFSQKDSPLGKVLNNVLDVLDKGDLTTSGRIRNVVKASEKQGFENVGAKFISKYILNDPTGRANQTRVSAEAVKAVTETTLLSKYHGLIKEAEALPSDLKVRLFNHRNNVSAGIPSKEDNKSLLKLSKAMDKAYDELYQMRKLGGVVGFDGSNKLIEGYMPRMVDLQVMNRIAQDDNAKAQYSLLIGDSMKRVVDEQVTHLSSAIAKIKESINELNELKKVGKLSDNDANKLSKYKQDIARLNGKHETLSRMLKDDDFFSLGQEVLTKMNPIFSNPGAMDFKNAVANNDIIEQLLQGDEFKEVRESLTYQIDSLKTFAVRSNRAKDRKKIFFDKVNYVKSTRNADGSLSDHILVDKDYIAKEGEVITKYQLSDLYNTDSGALLDQQIREASGEIGLASVGIKGQKDYERLVKVAHEDYVKAGASDKRSASFYREGIDIYARMLNRPVMSVTGASRLANTSTRRLKEYYNAITLESAGISQLNDFASVIAIGLRSALTPKRKVELDNQVKGAISHAIRSVDKYKDLVGKDHVLTQPTRDRIFEGKFEGETSEEFLRQQSIIEKTFRKYDEAMGHVTNALYNFNGMNIVTASQQRMALNLLSEDLMNAIGKHIVKGEAIDSRFRQLGLDASFIEAMKKYKKEGTIQFDYKGRIEVFKFKEMVRDDPNIADKFVTMLRTGINNRVMKSDVASSIPLFESPLGRLIGTLLNFVVMSYSKILLRHLNHLDREAFSYVVSAMVIGTLVYELRVGLKAMTSGEDRDFLIYEGDGADDSSLLLNDPLRASMLIANESSLLALPLFMYELGYNMPILNEISDEALGGLYTPSNAYFGSERYAPSKFNDMGALGVLPIVSITNRTGKAVRDVTEDIAQGEVTEDTLDDVLKVTPLGDHLAVQGAVTAIKNLTD